MAVSAKAPRRSAGTTLLFPIAALFLSSIIPLIAVNARTAPATEGSMDLPAQLGKRTLLASGLPKAVTSLPLTKIDRPDPLAHVTSFGGSSNNTAVLVATPVPLTGGYFALPSFTASVGVGTPPQPQTVIVDTGMWEIY